MGPVRGDAEAQGRGEGSQPAQGWTHLTWPKPWLKQGHGEQPAWDELVGPSPATGGQLLRMILQQHSREGTAAPMGHPRDGAIPPQARQPRSCHKVSEQEPARLRQGRRPYKPHPSLNGAKKKAPQRPATPGRRFPRSKIAGEDGRPKETSGWPHVAARRDGGAQRLRHSDRLVRSAGCPRYPLGTLEPGHA